MNYNLDLTDSKLQELTKAHKEISNKKDADKIKAIILLSRGYTYPEIEQILLISERQIRRLRDNYFANGIKGLLEKNYIGSEIKLDFAQKICLEVALEETPFGSAKEICAHVKKEYKVEYRPESMVKLLKRMGFSYKKTKQVPGKTSEYFQKKFINFYEKLKKNLKTLEIIYFLDATHPTYNSIPQRAWIKTGKEFHIKSTNGKKRININGVYSPCNNEVIVNVEKKMNSTTTINFFRKIEKLHPELKIIYIISDGAGYYNSKLVKEYLKTSKIIFIKLPPYCPNLNLIERLWKLLKKNVLYNKYYDDYEEFKDAALKFLRKKGSKHRQMLSILMAENFNILKPI